MQKYQKTTVFLFEYSLEIHLKLFYIFILKY